MKDHITTKRKRTTVEQSIAIKALYLQGLSVKEVSLHTGISHGSVFRALDKQKGTTRSLSLSHASENREHLFLDTSTEECQYWLGFLAADGALVHNQVLLNLAIKDDTHLDKFIAYTKAHKMYLKKTNSCRAYFSSQVVVKRLISYGITRRKTHTIEYLLPLTVHFVRGVFDGDGCISNTLLRITPKFSLVSASYVFILQLYNFFLSQGIQLNLTENKGLWQISTGKTSTVSALYKLLYEGSTIFLQRKYDRFGSVVQKYTTKQSANSGNSEPSIPSQQ